MTRAIAAALLFSALLPAQPGRYSFGVHITSVEIPNHARVTDVSARLLSLDRVVDAVSGPTGFAHFDNVPAGVYELRIDVPDFLPHVILSFEVPHRGSDPLEILLPPMPMLELACGPYWTVTYAPAPPANVSGMVSGFDSQKFANVTVSLTPLFPGLKERLTKTDARGNFSFANVAPGHYKAEAAKRGYHSRAIDDVLVPRENAVILKLYVSKCLYFFACE